jgi:hypothetical protein
MESSNGIIGFMDNVRANVAYEFRDCGFDFHEPSENSLEEASIQSIVRFQTTTNYAGAIKQQTLIYSMAWDGIDLR